MTTATPHAADHVMLERTTTVEPVRPPKFSVVLHNDDFTPMEFVVQILEGIFDHNSASAEAIMLAVHHEGEGTCGVYVEEIAETKVEQVKSIAEMHGHPLLCTMRPAGIEPAPGRPSL